MTVFVAVALIMLMLAALKSRTMTDKMAIGMGFVAGVAGFHFHQVILYLVCILILLYPNRHWVKR